VLLLLKASQVPLRRDVILAWTGDEESGGAGIRWQLENQPESIAAEIVLNEGGGLRLSAAGKPIFVELQTAEKTYQDFTITARGATGHSSIPLPDNAIYRLARGLARLSALQFPPRLLPVARATFADRAKLEDAKTGAAMKALAEAPPGELPAEALKVLEAEPTHAASLRTTCVATLIDGGTRVNALPSQAQATVNCRILPDESPDDVRRRIVEVLADPDLEVEASSEFGWGKPSPLEGPVPDGVRALVEETWPGVPVVPYMSRGATDSRFLRARGYAAYGMNPIGVTEADERRSHGIDERIPAASLRRGVELLYRLVVKLAATPQAAD
jgi:acetylornithine deacetylase/succinyl-diaminopimelate desuccinylase-like protein